MTGKAIREALEPFAEVAPDYEHKPDALVVSILCQVRDLRRARTAYDAIGSGVKALEWSEAGGATALGLSYDVWLTKDAAQGYREIWLAALMQGGRESIGTFSSKEKAQAACQADFERRVLSCLSPVAVEEADAKAVGPWHGMASAPRDGTYILASGLDFGTGPRRHFTVCLCLEGTDTFVEAEGGEELTYLDAWVPLPGAALLSPHTAAGAGPVGEAVAWRVRAYPGHRWQIVETIPHNFPRDWEKEPLHVRPSNEPVEAGESAAFDEWWAGSGRKASYASVLYDQAAWVAWKERASRARPVEEPGEVEQQRGWIYFNPGAGTEWAENHPVESGEVPDAEDIRPGTSEELLKHLLPAWRELATETSRRETAEAALAETRKRLEKVADGNRPLPYGRDELGRFVRDAWIRWAQTQPNPKPSWLLAYDELPEPDKEADRQIGETIARWTLIGDAARAALTGDAQEGGK